MVVTRRQAAENSAVASSKKKHQLDNLPSPVTMQKLIEVDLDLPAYFAGIIITYNLIITLPTIYQIGSRYIEPVYGSLLSARGQFFGLIISVFFGVVLGNRTFKVFAFNLSESLLSYRERFNQEKEGAIKAKSEFSIEIENEESQYMHAFDSGLIRVISYVFDVTAILIASAPIRLEAIFRLSSSLGPVLGPMASHAVLDYPVFTLVSIVGMLVSIRISFFGKTKLMRAVIGYAYFFVVGIAAASFHSVLARRPVCDSLVFQAVLLGLSGIILKLLIHYKNSNDKKLIYEFLNKNSSPDSDDSKKEKKVEKPEHIQIQEKMAKKKSIKRKNFKAFLSFLPFLLTAFLVYNSMFYSMNCSRDVSPLHNTDPKIQLVFKHESPFGFVEVVDLKTDKEYRVMRVGNSIIGGIWSSTKESVYGAFYYFDAVLFAKKQPESKHKTALQIGLGVGISAASFHNQGIFVDVVEINPSVYFSAVEYFGFPEDINSKHILDGRAYVEKANTDTYDYIIHDIFSGGPIPHHMFSKEFMKGVDRILKKDGIFIMNYVGHINDTLHIGTLKNTLNTVFGYTRCFVDSIDRPGKLQNMVFFASKNKIEFELPESVLSPSPGEDSIRSTALRSMASNELNLENMDLPPHSIITDQDNPLTVLDLSNAADYWLEMQEYFPQDFWIKF